MLMPIEAFNLLMKPFSTNEIKGLVWKVDKNGVSHGWIVPTRVTKANLFYEYEILHGHFLDKLFRLQDHDTARRKNAKDSRPMRGMGAAKLVLSHAGAMRGEDSLLLAMACGNVKLTLKQPRDWRALPEFTCRLKITTMDARGNILLPCEFEEQAYKMSLQKQLRILLQKMMADPGYPTGNSMQLALTQSAMTVRQDPTPALMMAPPDPMVGQEE